MTITVQESSHLSVKFVKVSSMSLLFVLLLFCLHRKFIFDNLSGGEAEFS